jgi:hypothetical protein
MVRMLAAVPDGEQVTEAHVEQALSNIDEHFTFVGFTEEYGKVIEWARETLGYDGPAIHENSSGAVYPREEMAELRVRPGLRWDWLLYNELAMKEVEKTAANMDRSLGYRTAGMEFPTTCNFCGRRSPAALEKCGVAICLDCAAGVVRQSPECATCPHCDRRCAPVTMTWWCKHPLEGKWGKDLRDKNVFGAPYWCPLRPLEDPVHSWNDES